MEKFNVNGVQVEVATAVEARAHPVVRIALDDGDKIQACDAAVVLGVTGKTLNTWVKNGSLQTFNKGRHVFIPWAQVKAKLDDLGIKRVAA